MMAAAYKGWSGVLRLKSASDRQREANRPGDMTGFKSWLLLKGVVCNSARKVAAQANKMGRNNMNHKRLLW